MSSPKLLNNQRILRTTEKAILFEDIYTEKQIWIPKSLIISVDIEVGGFIGEKIALDKERQEYLDALESTGDMECFW